MQSPFDFRGLRCFASRNDACLWHYLPRQADVQRDADDRPLLTMVDMGDTGYLLFTATWRARAQDLEALRRELEAAQRSSTVARLSFAPLSSVRCNALVSDSTGSYRAIASNATSGMPPYDAVFNVVLQDDRLAHAKAALRGERGHLGIEYLADVHLPVHAKATLRARSTDLRAGLRAGKGQGAALREMLEEAVRTGTAKVTIDAPDPHGSELAAELYARVVERAAELLPAFLEQGAPGDFEMDAALDKNVHQPTSAFADLGALVSARATESDTGGQDAAD